MSIETKAIQATDAILSALSSHDLSADEKAKISQMIHQAMVSAVEKTTQKYNEVTVICCGPEADLAHKIQEEVRRKTTLLISNLMALR